MKNVRVKRTSQAPEQAKADLLTARKRYYLSTFTIQITHTPWPSCPDERRRDLRPAGLLGLAAPGNAWSVFVEVRTDRLDLEKDLSTLNIWAGIKISRAWLNLRPGLFFYQKMWSGTLFVKARIWRVCRLLLKETGIYSLYIHLPWRNLLLYAENKMDFSLKKKSMGPSPFQCGSK